MHFFLHLFIHLVALTCVCKAGSLVTIDAAYCFNGGPGVDVVFLFSGKWVVGLSNNGQILKSERSKMRIPEDMHLQATFLTDPAYPTTKYFYGDKYGYLMFQKGSVPKARKFKYGPKRAFIRNGGPDAAARRDGAVQVFKGCKMAIRRRWYDWKLVQADIRTIGLPCNVDAAWTEQKGGMVVLKGDKFWRWESDGSVNGPHAFHDTYKLKDWTLKPSEEET